MPSKKPTPKDALDELFPEATPRQQTEAPSSEEPGAAASLPGPAAAPAPSEPAPTIALPVTAFDDMLPPKGAFSDEPPEGWGQGQGNVAQDLDPVTSQLDPVAAARASLLEDAARATGGNATSPRPAVPVTHKVGNRAPEIRQALARAAALPNTTKWRSRIAVGAAWQYDGALHSAPDWVDRNWLGYDDGPALEIPDVGTVKKSQWVVVQQVLNEHNEVSHEEVRVYDDADFRSLFMPEPPDERTRADRSAAA